MRQLRDRRDSFVKRPKLQTRVLEWLMVGNVVDLLYASYSRRRASLTTGAAVAVGDRPVEAAGEKAPGDGVSVQQVANVLSGHLKLIACRAYIAKRIGIVDN